MAVPGARTAKSDLPAGSLPPTRPSGKSPPSFFTRISFEPRDQNQVYACTGAVQITRSSSPVQDAARELRAAGYTNSDTLTVVCGEVTVMPATIGSILRHRPKVLRSAIERRYRHP